MPRDRTGRFDLVEIDDLLTAGTDITLVYDDPNETEGFTHNAFGDRATRKIAAPLRQTPTRLSRAQNR
ncbi:MAG: hypothetical protein AAGA47_13075 [Pseudomonadota bacterium]